MKDLKDRVREIMRQAAANPGVPVTIPEDVTEAIRQEMAEAARQRFGEQKPLDPRIAQALSDNLWDLYSRSELTTPEDPSHAR